MRQAADKHNTDKEGWMKGSGRLREGSGEEMGLEASKQQGTLESLMGQ